MLGVKHCVTLHKKDFSLNLFAFVIGFRASYAVDKFHILKIINEAVDAVRREEAKTNPLLKGTRFITMAYLLTGKLNFSKINPLYKPT